MRPITRRQTLAVGLAGLASPLVAQGRPVVAAVTYPLAYFAERLLGGAADVLFPVPAGRDPAFWRPGLAEIGAFQAADLILLNGAGFAAWTDKVTLPRGRLVDTSRGLEERLISTQSVTHSHGADGTHSHEATASFLWLDPDLAAAQAAAVAQGLSRRRIGGDPAAALAELTADLAELRQAGAALAGLAAGRPILATHPRYQYFARAFGLDIRALSWDAGAAPDAAEQQDAAALAAETGAGTLIWEAAPPEAARAAIRALGRTDAVMPTLANRPETGDFLTAYRAGLADLAAALGGQP